MVFNTQLIVAVANLPADFCQYCNGNTERLSSDEVLYLLFCFPFQEFRRFSLCVRTFFCFPMPNPFLSDFDSELDVQYSDLWLPE
ncbi:hypothetical protein R3W88_028107 [Solanum pinnatisectum]|uniref:Uncharacterized protein n=1 Tax=Solanum pinnatisectum TaxID=50273 RepID=A0AAV9LIN1_9SOLN|nr:hypothetical protein R3W88_028107 [Solanum pinnatisectum]